ncbi:hypothetical protein MLD38_003557 [Melastoma candidum]|uniref:Uncharacterized protein n=1 Tax=Melastoma candidum TaxID=119954 RepID=A0ACB9S330_9MYRT|nr:hypothetical protein MLD38_003557 [Melastoma candidum]
MGPTRAFELSLACLLPVVLSIGLCLVLWHCRARIRHACISDKWKRLLQRFLQHSVTIAATDGYADGGDVEVVKAFSDKGAGEGEEEDVTVSSLLIELQSRFLYTISEENEEDLCSNCGRSSGGDLSQRLSITKSLSDLGMRSIHRLSGSAPSTSPSKFKVLRDTEDEFCRRLRLEAEERMLGIRLSSRLSLPVEDSLWSKVVGRRKERDILLQITPTSSRALPLELSPGRISPAVPLMDK